MIRINKLTDYATLILSYLAKHEQEVCSVAQIVQHQPINTPTASKILKILSKTNIVKAHRGSAGGYQIAKPAIEITLAEIITAIEGEPSLTDCCLSDELCVIHTQCALKGNWNPINDIILGALSQHTLNDLMYPTKLNKTEPLNVE